MRSIGGTEDGISATLFGNNISNRPVASVSCEEHVRLVQSKLDRTADDCVCLPPRYRQRLLKAKDISSSHSPNKKETDDLDTREKDLGVALKWIRQEILQMKEQDKSLLKQFIELRASILQLRCMYEYHSFNSDISSMEGSTASLNDAHKRRHNMSIIPRADSDMLELKSRTKSLLSLPASPRCTTIKWRSDEFI